MRNPELSIIIPSFNRVELLVQTIQSVINQNFHNWELIIVDDGSDDNNILKVKEFIDTDDRVQFFIRDRSPKGASVCRNIGIHKAKGTYIMFLDSDDILASFCLHQRIEEFKKYPEYNFLVFRQLVINENNDQIYLWNIDTEDNDLDRFLKADSVWPISGPVYKAKIFSQNNYFDEELTCWQDLDLHIRLLISNYSYIKCSDCEPDVYIRYHDAESISQKGFYDINQLNSQLKVFSKISISSLKMNSAYKKSIKIKIFQFIYQLLLMNGSFRSSLKELKNLYNAGLISMYETLIGLSLLFKIKLFNLLNAPKFIKQKTINFYGKFLIPDLISVLYRIDNHEKIIDYAPSDINTRFLKLNQKHVIYQK